LPPEEFGFVAGVMLSRQASGTHSVPRAKARPARFRLSRVAPAGAFVSRSGSHVRCARVLPVQLRPVFHAHPAAGAPRVVLCSCAFGFRHSSQQGRAQRLLFSARFLRSRISQSGGNVRKSVSLVFVASRTIGIVLEPSDQMVKFFYYHFTLILGFWSRSQGA
jgi:hypothetical protein